MPGHGYCHGGREVSVRFAQVDIRGRCRGCEGKLSTLMITRFWSIGTGIPIGRSNSSHQRATLPGPMHLCPVSRPEQGRSLTWVPVVEVSRGWKRGSVGTFECGASTFVCGERGATQTGTGRDSESESGSQWSREDKAWPTGRGGVSVSAASRQAGRLAGC